jgi:hypothetical protein
MAGLRWRHPLAVQEMPLHYPAGTLFSPTFLDGDPTASALASSRYPLRSYSMGRLSILPQPITSFAATVRSSTRARICSCLSSSSCSRSIDEGCIVAMIL